MILHHININEYIYKKTLTKHDRRYVPHSVYYISKIMDNVSSL